MLSITYVWYMPLFDKRKCMNVREVLDYVVMYVDE